MSQQVIRCPDGTLAVPEVPVNRQVIRAGKGRLPHVDGAMRRFRVYRPNPPEGYRESGAANAPEDVQFEGVEFSDGTVCVRWLTEYRSHSIWASMDDLIQIHGHPEYGTKIVWIDA